MALALQQADYDLYRLSIDNPSPVVETPSTSRNEMDPAWSAVNSRMAFVTDRSGHEEIWLRSQEGDWQQPLVTSSAFGASPTYLLSAPAFSPDGGRIAYNRAGPEGYQIWISPVACSFQSGASYQT
jgi:Tol biopolymer transport system component